MVTEQPTAEGEPKAAVRAMTNSAYNTASEGTKAVIADYLYWTGRVSEWSVQLSYSVLAANWAVFTTLNGIMSNVWSYLSVAVAVLNLFLMVIFAATLALLHLRQAKKAEHNLEIWEEEFRRATGKRDPWPFTTQIEFWGNVFLGVRAITPVLAAVLFFIALCVLRWAAPK